MATFYVGSNNNDGDKRATQAWVSNGSEITNGITFGDSYITGIRFSSVNIPQGSTINSATLKGYTSSVGGQGGSEVVRIKIYGIDEDNTNDFSSDPTGRTTTTAAVDWDITPSPSTASHTSGSITTIVQEIVNRDGWDSGNSIGFLLKDDGSDAVTQRWYSYEGDSTKDFELTVTWTAPTTTTTTTTTTSVSSSISSSSSTSTSSSSTTTAPSMGIKITKSGRDVSSTTLDDFYMDSRYPLLKVHSYGTFTTGITGETTIEHNLGYIPFAFIFTQYVNWDGASSSITNEYYQHDWEQAGAEVTFFGRSKIYSDRIEIAVGNTNEVLPGAIDGFYYIFKDEVV